MSSGDRKLKYLITKPRTNHTFRSMPWEQVGKTLKGFTRDFLDAKLLVHQDADWSWCGPGRGGEPSTRPPASRAPGSSPLSCSGGPSIRAASCAPAPGTPARLSRRRRWPGSARCCQSCSAPGVPWVRLNILNPTISMLKELCLTKPGVNPLNGLQACNRKLVYTYFLSHL